MSKQTLRKIRIDTLPEGPFKDDELMEICYRKEIDRIKDALTMRQSVLIECDKQLVIPIISNLRKGHKNFIITENPTDRQQDAVVNQAPRAASLPGNPVSNLLVKLEKIVTSMDLTNSVVVLQNLDLMALGADNLLDRMARDMSYLLHYNPSAVFMAFKDPEIPLPESIRRFFPIEVSIFGIRRETLPRIITREEALRFGETEFDIYNIAKHVSGLNALGARKLFERIRGLCGVFPADTALVEQELRERTLAASYVHLPDITFDDIGGHHKVKEQLLEEILRFIHLLDSSKTLQEISDIETRLPRNILFEGPPGTGKTLLAKALANQLGAAVIVVHGPELFDKFVGESERKLREIFSKARKSAPAVIIFEEMDAIGRSRSEESDRANVGDTLVNQLLTEMGEFKNEELVFVIGTTNNAAALDPALLSRIQKIFHIGYPDRRARLEILGICNDRQQLGLSEEQLEFLTDKTEAWINPANWRRFGGREIQSLCDAIDRETFGVSRTAITIERLAELVDDKIEVHLPVLTFNDIGGYEDVKRILEDDLLDMMKLAHQNRENPERLAEIEQAIPRGVIFEGPPGTGKTMFATALAHALGASIIVISASELKGSFYGESEQRIRKLFFEARRNSPSIIVFDEMDAIMGSRNGDGHSDRAISSVDSSLVNQLLTEMDGLRSRDMVFIIGTTNLATAIDPAFKRPGRFSRIIHIPYPDAAARLAILGIYNKKFNLQLSEQQFGLILSKTETWIDANKYIRFSGDHLRGVCQTIQRVRLKQGADRPTDVEITGIIEAMVRTPFYPLQFDEIGGYEEVKRVLREDILDMLLLAKEYVNDPAVMSRIRHSLPKGVIFYGPPGTGKTMFARALATALNASIRVVSGPELKSAWHGETEKQIREIFEQARRYAPSIIVFDEFDSMAGSRDMHQGGTGGSVVNQILTEMDGFRPNEMVFVVATTNHIDFLDKAMVRPGRFEFKIEIPCPDETARRKIIEIYNRKYELNLDEELIGYLVFRTAMVLDIKTGDLFTGDHIEAVCRSLMREKLRNPGIQVTRELLSELVRGRTNQPEIISDREREVVAVHEAGHAIVGKYHPKGNPPRRITIVAEMAGTLGYVWHGEPENRYTLTRDDFLGQICQCLGGRSAEILVKGIHSVGCANDLEISANIAKAMATRFGMDDVIGPHFIHDSELAGAGGNAILSQRVTDAVSRILADCQELTEKILLENRQELEELVARLLRENTIDFI